MAHRGLSWFPWKSSQSIQSNPPPSKEEELLSLKKELSELESQFEEMLGDAPKKRVFRLFNFEKFTEEVSGVGLFQAVHNTSVGDPYSRERASEQQLIELLRITGDLSNLRSSGEEPSLFPLVDAVNGTVKLLSDRTMEEIIARKPRVERTGLEPDSIVPYNLLPRNSNTIEFPSILNPKNIPRGDLLMPRLNFWWAGWSTVWEDLMTQPEEEALELDTRRRLLIEEKYHSPRSNHPNIWYFNLSEFVRAFRTEISPNFVRALDNGDTETLKILLAKEMVREVKKCPPAFRNPRFDPNLKRSVLLGIGRKHGFIKFRRFPTTYRRVNLRIKATKTTAVNEAHGPTALMSPELDTSRRPYRVLYRRIRFEYYPNGAFKFIAFEWNNTGYAKRRRTRGPRFLFNTKFSKKLNWRKDRRKDGRLSRIPMRGPRMLNKAQPPSLPRVGGGFDVKVQLRRRMRKTGYPQTNQFSGYTFLHWFPYDMLRHTDREKEEEARRNKMT